VPEDVFVRHFKIATGEHYSSPRLLEVLQEDRLVFKARFDQSAKYDLGSEALQTNKNKLLGFSDCNSLHHENSARFAWQWHNNQIEIFAYCYQNGQRVESFVGTVEIDAINLYQIQVAKNDYIFSLNNETPVTIQRGAVCQKGAYYFLWPYFGGSLPAPHEVNIEIEIIRN
jgi:5-methylcytosine-specific restriction endonuclease McrBC regulatory subunit McrC